MTLHATLLREVTGPTGHVHPIGEVVTMKMSELWCDVKLEDGSEDRVPHETLRTECEVPGCAQDTKFVAPGHWCQKHWTEWSDLERPEPGPEWMQPDRERPESVVTLRETGTPVTLRREWLMVYAEVLHEEIDFQFHRQDLSIQCEREGCTEEADTWNPAYLCKKDWRAWCDGEFKLPEDGEQG